MPALLALEDQKQQRVELVDTCQHFQVRVVILTTAAAAEQVPVVVDGKLTEAETIGQPVVACKAGMVEFQITRMVMADLAAAVLLIMAAAAAAVIQAAVVVPIPLAAAVAHPTIQVPIKQIPDQS